MSSLEEVRKERWKDGVVRSLQEEHSGQVRPGHTQSRAAETCTQEQNRQREILSFLCLEYECLS